MEKLVKSANGQWTLVEKVEVLTKPPVSEAQRKAMWAAASGNSDIGIPQEVGKEFAAADTGGKLPENKTKKQELDKNTGPLSYRGAAGDNMTKDEEMDIKRIKQKYTVPKKQSTEEKIQSIKDQNRDVVEPPFEEQVENIRQKYKQKVKKVEKSGYGPKDAGLYNPVDNIKRKENRTGEVLEDVGQNKAVHQYTSAPMGSAKQQANIESKRDKVLSAKQPVKVYTDEEKAKLQAEYNSKLKKSTSWSVQSGLQPSKEQWEQAVAQQLGLPANGKEADKLNKADNDRWNNILNDFFTEASKPVEQQNTTPASSRGRIDQDDESKLTDEEQRIRAIPVNPKLLDV